MKYLYPLSLMLVLLASCGKDEEKVIDSENTDWAFYKLQGEVKAVSEKSYETSDGKTTGISKHEIASEHNKDLEFNEEGMLISEKLWLTDTVPYSETSFKGKDFKITNTQYANGVRSLKTDYVWDEAGKNNLSVIRRNADNSPFDKVVMKYKNDKLLERITYNQQENPTGRVTYYYDNKGNLKGMNNYMSTDIVQYKTEYQYNDNNQKVLEKYFNKDGVMDYETRYTYSGDKLATSETYNADGELSYSEKKSYDKEGNLTSDYSFDKFDGRHMRDVYIYDKNGNKTSWEVLEGDKLKMKVAYNYDKYNNITKILAVDSEGNVIESKLYNYEYDSTGNWTKKVYFQNDRPMVITERTITYFE